MSLPVWVGVGEPRGQGAARGAIREKRYNLPHLRVHYTNGTHYNHNPPPHTHSQGSQTCVASGGHMITRTWLPPLPYLLECMPCQGGGKQLIGY